jgi:hypothetical protein
MRAWSSRELHGASRLLTSKILLAASLCGERIDTAKPVRVD